MTRYHFSPVFATFCLLGAALPLAAQSSEYQALQNHFERVMTARFNTLFDGIGTAAQWEERKQRTRAALERMLWHDLRWPAGPPPATITGREERREYSIENLVLETLPKLHLTANLYLPQGGRKPFPVVLYLRGQGWLSGGRANR